MSDPDAVQGIVQQAEARFADRFPYSELTLPHGVADFVSECARQTAEAGIREGLRRGAEMIDETRREFHAGHATLALKAAAAALRSAAEGQP